VPSLPIHYFARAEPLRTLRDALRADLVQFRLRSGRGSWTNRVQLRQCANLRRWRTPT
jgi:hypothetical protein